MTIKMDIIPCQEMLPFRFLKITAHSWEKRSYPPHLRAASSATLEPPHPRSRDAPPVGIKDNPALKELAKASGWAAAAVGPKMQPIVTGSNVKKGTKVKLNKVVEC